MIFRKYVNTFLISLFLGFLLFAAGTSAAQERGWEDYSNRYENGTQLYLLEKWQEAAMEFRRAQEISPNDEDWSQALYWVILSELAYSDYGSAVLDMESLERRVPNSAYTRDMVYHRARIYFNQAYFDDALLLFRRYISSVSNGTDTVTIDRIAAAYFWMGECLYTMGQFEEAEKFYIWVIDNYPKSPKLDACLFRLELIKQKKIEAELLALLQWSHEESLKSSETYQRTIRTYEQILNEYQKRIVELSGGSISMSEFQMQSSNNMNEDFLERAKYLIQELERIIREHYSGVY